MFITFHTHFPKRMNGDSLLLNTIKETLSVAQKDYLNRVMKLVLKCTLLNEVEGLSLKKGSLRDYTTVRSYIKRQKIDCNNC